MLRCTQRDTWQLCAGEAGGLRQCCRNSAVGTSEIDLAMASEAARPAGGAECEVRNRGEHSSPGGSNADPAAVLSRRQDVHAQGWQPAHILAAGLLTLEWIQRKCLTDRCQSCLARLAALPPPALVPLPVAAARAEQKVQLGVRPRVHVHQRHRHVRGRGDLRRMCMHEMSGEGGLAV